MVAKQPATLQHCTTNIIIIAFTDFQRNYHNESNIVFGYKGHTSVTTVGMGYEYDILWFRMYYFLTTSWECWLTGVCSARQGASVPIKLLHSSLLSHYTVASTLRCKSSADRTSTSSQHLRSAGICCRWSDDVIHSSRWSTRSCSQHSNLRTAVELKTDRFSAYQHV